MGNTCIQNAMREIEELVKKVRITRLSNITKKTVESLGGKSTIVVEELPIVDILNSKDYSDKIHKTQGLWVMRDKNKPIQSYGNPFYTVKPVNPHPHYVDYTEKGNDAATQAYYDWIKSNKLPDGLTKVQKEGLEKQREWIIEHLPVVAKREKIHYFGTARDSKVNHATALLLLAEGTVAKGKGKDIIDSIELLVTPQAINEEKMEEYKVYINKLLEELPTNEIKSNTKGHKSIFFSTDKNPVPYMYSIGGGRHTLHTPKPMEEWMKDLAKLAEKLDGQDEGYYNEVLINKFEDDVGIGSHTDIEANLRGQSGEKDSRIAIFSIGDTKEPHSFGANQKSKFQDTRKKAERTAPSGSLVVMESGGLLHRVAPADGTRYSITFRHSQDSYANTLVSDIRPQTYKKAIWDNYPEYKSKTGFFEGTIGDLGKKLYDAYGASDVNNNPDSNGNAIPFDINNINLQTNYQVFANEYLYDPHDKDSKERKQVRKVFQDTFKGKTGSGIRYLTVRSLLNLKEPVGEVTKKHTKDVERRNQVKESIDETMAQFAKEGKSLLGDTNSNPFGKNDAISNTFVEEDSAGENSNNYNKSLNPLTTHYKRDIQKGAIKINTIDELIEFSEKYNDSIDGTKMFNGYNIRKGTKWYTRILKDMKAKGFDFQPIEIVVVDELKDNKGTPLGASGMMMTNNGDTTHTRILLAKDATNPRLPISTVVHEYIHAITAESIDNDPAVKKQIRAMMDKAAKALGNRVNDPKINYAFTNEKEFLAEVVSNPYLQNALNNIEATKGFVERAIKLFKAIMSRFKGDKATLLDEALNTVYQIQLGNKKEIARNSEGMSRSGSVNMNQSRPGFDNKLNKKLTEILKRLYPEIKLEYTEDGNRFVDADGNVMNQEQVDTKIKIATKVVEVLYDLGTAKPSKHGGKPAPVLETIRVKQEVGVRKRLASKGVSKEQVDFVFEFMKQNDIAEIKTGELAEKVLFGLTAMVEIKQGQLRGKPYHARIQELEYLHESDPSIPAEWFENKYKEIEDSSSDSYKDLTVPGGKNYKEMEISTPGVRAELRGHADFATDEGIGWYRVDDTVEGNTTLRVLEMQSDMFQKMKDKDLAIEHKEDYYLSKEEVDRVYSSIAKLEQKLTTLKEGTSAYTRTMQEIEDKRKMLPASDTKELNRSFHQMLNTNSKWVKFFIQSIVQDSQKNGYEKIRFPDGNTVAKVEGYTEEHRSQGVMDFYDKNVKNTLIKAYGKKNIKTVKDEHGNSWFELALDKSRDAQAIMFQKDNGNQILGQANIKAKTVLINSLLQKQDTLPHEYAHHYIAMFRDAPIVQEAIKKWGNEEKLVQAIGEQVVKQKGEVYGWWKEFTAWLREKFSKLSNKDKEELKNLLTDSFLQREDLSNQTTASANKVQDIMMANIVNRIANECK